jgi:hypothetical protein
MKKPTINMELEIFRDIRDLFISIVGQAGIYSTESAKLVAALDGKIKRLERRVALDRKEST